jgi:hypothetical protein
MVSEPKSSTIFVTRLASICAYALSPPRQRPTNRNARVRCRPHPSLGGPDPRYRPSDHGLAEELQRSWSHLPLSSDSGPRSRRRVALGDCEHGVGHELSRCRGPGCLRFWRKIPCLAERRVSSETLTLLSRQAWILRQRQRPCPGHRRHPASNLPTRSPACLHTPCRRYLHLALPGSQRPAGPDLAATPQPGRSSLTRPLAHDDLVPGKADAHPVMGTITNRGQFSGTM